MLLQSLWGGRRTVDRVDTHAKCCVLKRGFQGLQGGQEPTKPTLNHQSRSIILRKKNFHFCFVLLSWQATAVNLALTCFCLLACFKLAHIFDMVVMTLLQKSSSSHPSPCQQCKGAVQVWLYPSVTQTWFSALQQKC